MVRTQQITKYDNVIDSRDVIARIEELVTDRDSFVLGSPDGKETPNPEGWAEEYSEDAEELAALKALASEAEGYAPDWEYGAMLIRDSYFKDYAQELCEDTGDVPKSFPSYIEIDWEATARNIQQDYTSVEFDGVDYWVR